MIEKSTVCKNYTDQGIFLTKCVFAGDVTFFLSEMGLNRPHHEGDFFLFNLRTACLLLPTQLTSLSERPVNISVKVPFRLQKCASSFIMFKCNFW